MIRLTLRQVEEDLIKQMEQRNKHLKNLVKIIYQIQTRNRIKTTMLNYKQIMRPSYHNIQLNQIEYNSIQAKMKKLNLKETHHIEYSSFLNQGSSFGQTFYCHIEKIFADPMIQEEQRIDEKNNYERLVKQKNCLEENDDEYDEEERRRIIKEPQYAY